MAKKIETPADLLNLVAKILQELMIDFCVSGGYAVCIWGKPRFTADLDIVINLEEKKITELAERLKNELPEAYVDEEQMEQATRDINEFNVIEPSLGMKIDFFTLQNDEYDKLMLRRSVVKDVGRPVRFISPEDLIIAKLKWYKLDKSARHFEDIRSVLIMNKIDKNYLDTWINKFKLIKVWERVKVK